MDRCPHETPLQGQMDTGGVSPLHGGATQRGMPGNCGGGSELPQPVTKRRDGAGRPMMAVPG